MPIAGATTDQDGTPTRPQGGSFKSTLPIDEAGKKIFDVVARHHGDRSRAIEAMAEVTPLGRFALPDEIAAQIAFLLSNLAATITGATLVSDGGYSL